MAGFWSIESGEIRFGKDGRWYSDDEWIENPRIASLFSRHLLRAEDGCWWIVMGDEKAQVVIEDTPWVVTRVDGTPDTGFTLGLNDGSSEPLRPESLRLGPDHVLYGKAKDGQHPVRFLRAPQMELLAHAGEDAGVFFLPGPNAQRWPLQQRVDG